MIRNNFYRGLMVLGFMGLLSSQTRADAVPIQKLVAEGYDPILLIPAFAPGTNLTLNEQSILTQINNQLANACLAALTLDSSLAIHARYQAIDQNRRQYSASSVYLVSGA